MSVRWTEEQKKVIDVRNKNVLVSAAAGSGKTAVLVERILSLVCGEGEDEKPLLFGCEELRRVYLLFALIYA